MEYCRTVNSDLSDFSHLQIGVAGVCVCVCVCARARMHVFPRLALCFPLPFFDRVDCSCQCVSCL